jgi:hypothetical protein
MEKTFLVQSITQGMLLNFDEVSGLTLMVQRYQWPATRSWQGEA